jgi:hypothetical protein
LYKFNPFIETILIQNSCIWSLFVIRTRRYRLLLKLKFTPFLVGLTYSKLLLTLVKTATANNLFFLDNLQRYYLESNLWFFYKHNLYNSSGLVLNNTHKSYNYWIVRSKYNLLFLDKITQFYKVIKPLHHYTKHVRVIHFAVTKYVLKRSFIFTLRLLLKLHTPYLNKDCLTYNFLIISNLHDFLLFYNFYYFKIHNY